MEGKSENKRIAKNSLFLYLRMFVLLVVGLYTSRVNLMALGVSDYGISNVVGGLVSMFVFINYAMVNSTMRYVTYELGRGDKNKLNLIFSTSINIHAIISFIIVVLSETIGLWFLYHKMVIPPERMTAAFWVFQFSVISCVVDIMSVPYNALIIAHEKMAAFAYISLLDAVFKLIIASLLLIYGGDRLVLFAFLVLLVIIIDRIIYGVYCQKHFVESKYHYVVDKSLMSEMTKFATWNLLGNFSWICCTQGLNLLLNVFFTPVVNAARGIAVSIQGVVSNFSYNIENAIKPQITKSYSQNDLSRMHTLIIASARMSYYALLFISLPIFMEINQILDLWLVEVPEHTGNFVRLTILILLSDTLANPLLTAVQATGELKKYQLTVSLLSLAILPVSYVILLFFPLPEVVFVVSLIISLVIQFVKLWIVGPMIHLPMWSYLKDVFIRAFVVTAFSMFVVVPVYYLFDASIWRLLASSCYCCLAVLLFSYVIGLNSEERCFLKAKVVSFFGKRNM